MNFLRPWLPRNEKSVPFQTPEIISALDSIVAESTGPLRGVMTILYTDPFAKTPDTDTQSNGGPGEPSALELAKKMTVTDSWDDVDTASNIQLCLRLISIWDTRCLWICGVLTCRRLWHSAAERS